MQLYRSDVAHQAYQSSFVANLAGIYFGEVRGANMVEPASDMGNSQVFAAGSCPQSSS
jgi:hypothetical protein